jgi:hypothetical protein
MDCTEGTGSRARKRMAPWKGAFSGAVLIVGLLAFGAVPAFANAPNPISTTGSVVKNSNGTYTLTVQGTWSWATQTNCPTNRNGVGYNVDWFDGNTANPIGTSSSPNGILYVGDSADNIVHSLENLDPSNTDTAFPGVPANYLTHNTTSSAPNSTDAKDWASNCGSTDPTTKISSGTWGPISHTYNTSGPFKVCAVMYDPHGNGTASGGNIGTSSVKDITAGGSGRNQDNSYEANGTGTTGNQCTTTTFTPPSNPPTTTTTSTPPPTTTTTTTSTPPPVKPVVKPTKKTHKKSKKHAKAKRVSRPPKVNSGFTG